MAEFGGIVAAWVNISLSFSSSNHVMFTRSVNG